MSYKVSFDALDSLCVNINTQVGEWSTDINSISGKLNAILGANHITGDGAENIKSYLQTVHVAIIQSLVSILQSHGQNCLMYKSDYQQNIDTSLHAVIKCEELFDIRNQLTTKRREMWSVDSNISDALTTVNDLIYNSLSNGEEMDELYGTINTSLLNLESDIAELESNHLNNDFPDVQNMISALKIFINDQLSRSRAYLVEYTPKQLANSDVYANLFNANQALVTSQSARAEEFQLACEYEKNRAELLEEEAAQKREEEGWWSALAAIGTIVIGTAAIVFTAGMATPIVVTAVTTGSCSIAYGASNLVEAGQDIYYGSIGDATTVAFNPIRDTVFVGNQELYDIWGGISVTVAGFVVPVGQAYTTAKATGSTTKVVLTTTGNALLKEGVEDTVVNIVSSGAGNAVMDLTSDMNASRLFSLGAGFFAGGKINSVDNATDAIRKVYDVTDTTKKINSMKDITVVEYGDHFYRQGRKKALKPNIEYTDSNGYKYRTDEVGRITHVEGQLQLGSGERNAYAQRTVGGDDRLPTDDGGHLIARRFNSSGDIDNLLPQSSNINRAGGEWYMMEQDWANALNKNQTVNVDIRANFSNNSTRPDSFSVTYWINGEKTVKNIKNN